MQLQSEGMRDVFSKVLRQLSDWIRFSLIVRLSNRLNQSQHSLSALTLLIRIRREDRVAVVG